MTTTTIATQFNVTEAQVSAAHRIVDLAAHQIFYVVESATSDSEYKVIYNRSLKALQCLPFSGPACKASENGTPCWHKRAAMAAAAEYKAERDAMEEVAMSELQAEIDAEVTAMMERINAAPPQVATSSELAQAQMLNDRRTFRLMR